MPDASGSPRVGIVMGSDSDWPVMGEAAAALGEFGVPFEADVVSAHRMPDAMIERVNALSTHDGSGSLTGAVAASCA